MTEPVPTSLFREALYGALTLGTMATLISLSDPAMRHLVVVPVLAWSLFGAVIGSVVWVLQHAPAPSANHAVAPVATRPNALSAEPTN